MKRGGEKRAGEVKGTAAEAGTDHFCNKEERRQMGMVNGSSNRG